MPASGAPAVRSSLLTLDVMLSRLLVTVRALHETETVSTLHASGRVLVQAVRSSLSMPLADNMQMDRYAVCTTDITAPDTRLEVVRRIPVGHVGRPPNIDETTCIFTDALIPSGADAVVMQGQCKTGPNSGIVTVDYVPEPDEWICRAGEDIADGAKILSHGIHLGSQQFGLTASVDRANLHVVRRPCVAVFFTGDEFAMPGEPLKPGVIYNPGRFTLRTLPENLGYDIIDFGIVPGTL